MTMHVSIIAKLQLIVPCRHDLQLLFQLDVMFFRLQIICPCDMFVPIIKILVMCVQVQLKSIENVMEIF